MCESKTSAGTPLLCLQSVRVSDGSSLSVDQQLRRLGEQTLLPALLCLPDVWMRLYADNAAFIKAHEPSHNLRIQTALYVL